MARSDKDKEFIMLNIKARQRGEVQGESAEELVQIDMPEVERYDSAKNS